MNLRILLLSLVAVAFCKTSYSFAQNSDSLDQEVADIEDVPKSKEIKTPANSSKKTEAWTKAVKIADENADDESDITSIPNDTKDSTVDDEMDNSSIAEEVDVVEKEDSLSKSGSEKTPVKTPAPVKNFKITTTEVKRTAPKLEDNAVTAGPSEKSSANSFYSPIEKTVEKSVGKSKLNSNAEVDYSTVTPGTESPNPRAIFHNPKGQEKVIKVYHPNAGKGLIRINKDRSYQYKVPAIGKTKAMSFSLSAMSAPVMTYSLPKSTSSIDYKTMYGGGSVYGMLVNYEWIPFQKFGSLGLMLETGLSVAHGSGTLVSGGAAYPAQETYTLLIIPISAFLKYRLEYWKNQWLVPYVVGGGTYYGLGELRSGDNKFHPAGTAAVGGGGGVQINLSKFDQNGSFGLAREYGVANLWLNFEARAMAGLKKDLDFTNTTFNFGMVADY